MGTGIEIEKLSKRYKDVQAVEDLSLELKKGEIYGFIGLKKRVRGKMCHSVGREI